MNNLSKFFPYDDDEGGMTVSLTAEGVEFDAEGTPYILSLSMQEARDLVAFLTGIL